jgi:hypothetical protein
MVPPPSAEQSKVPESRATDPDLRKTGIEAETLPESTPPPRPAPRARRAVRGCCNPAHRETGPAVAGRRRQAETEAKPAGGQAPGQTARRRA